MLTKTQCLVLTEDNFQANVLAGQTPILVDCWASWCSSFQQINPVLEELAIAFAGQIQIGRAYGYSS
jgi:thioredoxin 1